MLPQRCKLQPVRSETPSWLDQTAVSRMAAVVTAGTESQDPGWLPASDYGGLLRLLKPTDE